MKPIRFLMLFLTLSLVSSMILINCKSKTNADQKSAEPAAETLAINQLTQAEADDGWIFFSMAKPQPDGEDDGRRLFPIPDGPLKKEP